MTDTQKLRAAVDSAVFQLGHDFPKQELARALMVKSYDILLADVGAMGTSAMVNRSAHLLCGCWVPKFTDLFIETGN